MVIGNLNRVITKYFGEGALSRYGNLGGIHLDRSLTLGVSKETDIVVVAAFGGLGVRRGIGEDPQNKTEDPEKKKFIYVTSLRKEIRELMIGQMK